MASYDPRDIVTPYAFKVSQELIGEPLAGPSRRALAMAIDGVLIAVLANAPSVLLGFAAAIVLFRVSARSAPGGYIRTTVRLSIRFAAAILLFVMVIVGWGSVRDWVRGFGRDAPAASADAPAPKRAAQAISAIAVAGQVASLQSVQNEEQARNALQGIARGLTATGMDSVAVRETVREVAQETGQPWIIAVADSVVRGMKGSPPDSAATDTVLSAAAAALVRGDTTELDSLRPRLLASVAADTLAKLQRQIRQRDRQNRELREELEEAEESREGGGILGILRTLADDLGLGFGWSGLYFTAFLALWRGQTPGKRLMRTRVVRLDGKPMTWWAAFERFGGYAASLATGLLGFFQILWDANRQGIHDKIANTVVVQLYPGLRDQEAPSSGQRPIGEHKQIHEPQG